jgi:hypothetical protein
MPANPNIIPIVPNGAAIGGCTRRLIHNYASTTFNLTGERPTSEELQELFGRSPGLIAKVLSGELEPKEHAGGRKRTLKFHHLVWLRAFILECPFEKQAVYAAALDLRFFREFPTFPLVPSLISKAIKGMGLSLQACRNIDGQVNDGDIYFYSHRFPFLANDYGTDVAWFDATGVSRDTGLHNVGYAEVGAGGVTGYNSANGPNITVFGLMDKNGYFMHRSFDGSTDLIRILDFFHEAVVELKMRGIRVVCLDNASMHQVAWLSAILFSHGIDVRLFLPNYYPWWNPIEQVWQSIKCRLTALMASGKATHAMIKQATLHINSDMCLSFIHHCGIYSAFTKALII